MESIIETAVPKPVEETTAAPKPVEETTATVPKPVEETAATVPKPLENLKVSYLLDKIMMDDATSKRIKASIDNIMRDGKIDQFDIPEIIFLITDITSSSSAVSAKLTADDLTALIKQLYKFIEKQYNLIPDATQQASFERLIDSCIKLIMIQPKIKNAVSSCLKKLNTCCK
jgi:hypothetical protein